MLSLSSTLSSEAESGLVGITSDDEPPASHIEQLLYGDDLAPEIQDAIEHGLMAFAGLWALFDEHHAVPAWQRNELRRIARDGLTEYISGCRRSCLAPEKRSPSRRCSHRSNGWTSKRSSARTRSGWPPPTATSSSKSASASLRDGGPTFPRGGPTRREPEVRVGGADVHRWRTEHCGHALRVHADHACVGAVDDRGRPVRVLDQPRLGVLAARDAHSRTAATSHGKRTCPKGRYPSRMSATVWHAGRPAARGLAGVGGDARSFAIFRAARRAHCGDACALLL